VDNFAPPTKRLLAKAGWQLLRQGKGDHEIWHDPKSGRKVTIDNSMKSRHLANKILKFAGLPKAF